VRVHAGGHLVGELPLEQLRQPAGILRDLHAANDLALGVVEHLAVLAADDAREVVDVLLHQVAELEHHARAAGQGHLAPRLEGGARRLHGAVDVTRVGQQDLGLGVPGRGVIDGSRPLGGPARLEAGDLVLDGLERRRAHEVFTFSRVLRNSRWSDLWRS
jgi:hypothetical protein